MSGDVANWVLELKERYGLEVLTVTKLKELMGSNRVLYVTRCCATEVQDAQGLPERMYANFINNALYAFGRSYKRPFAVVSDLYGLHFQGEVRPRYDLHPSNLTAEQVMALGKRIRRLAIGSGFKTLVYYTNSPQRAIAGPYLDMLKASRLKCYFTTWLPRPGHLKPTPAMAQYSHQVAVSGEVH